MKAPLKIALATSLLCGALFAQGEQTPQQASERLDMLVKFMKVKGLNAFNFLNGTGEESGTSKHQTTEDGLEWSALTKASEKEGLIVCFQQGKTPNDMIYAAYPANPSMTGKDAINGPTAPKDDLGKNYAVAARDAFRQNPGKGRVSVAVVDVVPGVTDPKTGKPVQNHKIFVAASSSELLGRKNDTGRKFFCGVMCSSPSA